METLIFTSPLLFASRCAVICSILFTYYCQAAQTQNSYHVFTDKKGKSIEATPVSISPDKTKLQIQRKDGNQFEISIMTLNLDEIAKMPAANPSGEAGSKAKRKPPKN